MINPIQIRPCDSCTECCNGWLEATIHDHTMKPGVPCKYRVNTGCSIYVNRPVTPCKEFICQWAFDFNIPDWMKPDKVKVLCTTHKVGKHIILELRECGQTMSSEVLNWMFLMFISKKILNVKYQLNSKWYYLSSELDNLAEYIKEQMNE